MAAPYLGRLYLKDKDGNTTEVVLCSVTRATPHVPGQEVITVAKYHSCLPPTKWEKHTLLEGESLGHPSLGVIFAKDKVPPRLITATKINVPQGEKRKASHTIGGKKSPHIPLLSSLKPEPWGEWFDHEEGTLTIFAEGTPEVENELKRRAEAVKGRHFQLLAKELPDRLAGIRRKLPAEKDTYLKESYSGWSFTTLEGAVVSKQTLENARRDAFHAASSHHSRVVASVLGGAYSFLGRNTAPILEKCSSTNYAFGGNHYGAAAALQVDEVFPYSVGCKSAKLIAEIDQTLARLIHQLETQSEEMDAPLKPCLETLSVVPPAFPGEKPKQPSKPLYFGSTPTTYIRKFNYIQQNFFAVVPREQAIDFCKADGPFPPDDGFVLLVRKAHCSSKSPKYVLANVIDRRCIGRDQESLQNGDQGQKFLCKGELPAQYLTFEEAQTLIQEHSPSGNHSITMNMSPSNQWVRMNFCLFYHTYFLDAYPDDSDFSTKWSTVIAKSQVTGRNRDNQLLIASQNLLLQGGDLYAVYPVNKAILFKEKIKVANTVNVFKDERLRRLVAKPDAELIIPSIPHGRGGAKNVAWCDKFTIKIMAIIEGKFTLNASQKAVLLSLGAHFYAVHTGDKDAKKRFVQIVQGPPGCGKTTFLALAALFTVMWWDEVRPGELQKNRVLAVSQKNTATNNIAEKADEMFQKFAYEKTALCDGEAKYNRPVARVGRREKITSPSLLELQQESLEEELCSFLYPNAAKQMVGMKSLEASLASRVITCTVDCLLSTLDRTWDLGGKNRFRLVFVNEASTFSRFDTLTLALLPIDGIVFIGDLEQLPVFGLDDMGKYAAYAVSPMALFREYASEAEPHRLLYHYRSAYGIFSHFARYTYDNSLIYSRKEEDAANTTPSYLIFSCQDSREELYSQNETDSLYAIANRTEGTIVMELLQAYLEKLFGPNETEWAENLKQFSVCLMAPYRGQVALFEVLLRDCEKWPRLSSLPAGAIQIMTTDASLGKEYNLVIASTVRTQAIGFLKDEKRANVLCSRAIDHFALVCNPDVFEQAGGEYYRHLLDDAHARHCLVEIRNVDWSLSHGLGHILARVPLENAAIESQVEFPPEAIENPLNFCLTVPGLEEMKQVETVYASIIAPGLLYYIKDHRKSDQKKVLIAQPFSRELEKADFTLVYVIDTGAFVIVEKASLRLQSGTPSVGRYYPETGKREFNVPNLPVSASLDEGLCDWPQKLQWKHLSSETYGSDQLMEKLEQKQAQGCHIFKLLRDLRMFYKSPNGYRLCSPPKDRSIVVGAFFVCALTVAEQKVGFFRVKVLSIDRLIVVSCIDLPDASFSLSDWRYLKPLPACFDTRHVPPMVNA